MSFWLGIIGAILGFYGESGIWFFKKMKAAGIWLIEFSFRFDKDLS